MSAAGRLQAVGLFQDMPSEDLVALCENAVEVALADGEVLFREGDVGDRAYVVSEGALEVVKQTEGRDVVLAVHGPGAVVGEMALLREAPRMATVRARQQTNLVAIPKDTLDQLLANSPSAARAMFSTLVARMADTAEQLRHSERMAQLGTLTAGVAHELNNPAAAVRRAASLLADHLDSYTRLLLKPVADGGAARKAAWEMVSRREDSDQEAIPRPLDGLARSDLEDEIAGLLEDHGVPDAWELAPSLVDARLDIDALGAFMKEREGAELADAVQFAVAALEVRALVRGIDDASGRLAHIIKALKGYTYLDRAPVQNVDIIEGLETTLVLMTHKLGNVRVVRDYASDLPRITAVGGDLNQVWTNLIDNACDALADAAQHDATDEHGGPTLTLKVSASDDDVIVAVTDNGPGIPVDAQAKIFDAFFTTKPPGMGTGLGLPTSYRIIAHEHHGSLTFTSQPGATTFTVSLPRSGPGPGRTLDPAGLWTGGQRQ
ncbi:MAG: cyclic nucleotide-binding domain-containing protein [Nitriliruptoraceae bacterium]